MYAEVSVVGYKGSDKRTFTYRVAEGVVAQAGNLVSIKFGKNQTIGIVSSISRSAPSKDIKLKSIDAVLPIDPLPKELIALCEWLIDYYSAPPASVWQLMLPKNPTTTPRKLFDKPKLATKKLVELSPAQAKVYRDILTSERPTLLEGVMGSGKTEIYFHLIAKMLAEGKSAIMLMPEIFLTNQMIERAQKHFADQLVVAHSGLSPAQRRAVWVECNSKSANMPMVVLGPRSALFMPLHKLGLIVVDECHEQSYKQDSSPRYHAEMVAGKLASLTGAKLVLGSATPSVATRFLADAGKLQRLCLKERAITSSHPHIKIVKKDKQSEIFTPQLSAAINQTLVNKKLVMLYLNRRGTAPIFVCNDCGQGFECPHCGVNLHFHADSMRLVCHVCGFKQTPPAKCPSCEAATCAGLVLAQRQSSKRPQNYILELGLCGSIAIVPSRKNLKRF